MTVQETYYALNPWWEKRDFDAGILRPDYVKPLSGHIDKKQIDIIIGSRRVGKTTVLKQLVKATLKRGVNATDVLYLALDHPQLAGVSISEHLRNFRTLFEHDRNHRLVLLLDEVQESKNWEIELKALYDHENVKVVCTGSTASLLMSQGGKLTGRQFVSTVYPLSFAEFLLFRNESISGAEEYKYEQLAEDYLQGGGYPENALNPSEDYLATLLDDIIARDLIRLYQIRRPDVLKDLYQLLTASVGSRTSYTKLAHALGISVDTAREYIGYFEAAFLVSPMTKWTPSHTERVYTAKKIYLTDTGMKTIVTGRGDLGAKAENAVYLKLMRGGIKPGYYTRDKREVDFVFGDALSPMPIEAKYVDEFDWEDRRYLGLKSFLDEHNSVDRAIIVTRRGGKSITHGHTVIDIEPLWRFLLKGVGDKVL